MGNEQWAIACSAHPSQFVTQCQTTQRRTGLASFSMSLDPTDTSLVLRDVGSDDICALTLQEK